MSVYNPATNREGKRFRQREENTVSYSIGTANSIIYCFYLFWKKEKVRSSPVWLKYEVRGWTSQEVRMGRQVRAGIPRT